MKPRTSPPRATTKLHDNHPYRVWAKGPSYAEDTKPWKCSATFYYLSECLEYISDRQFECCDLVFQSPTGCRAISAADTNVVCGRHALAKHDATTT